MLDQKCFRAREGMVDLGDFDKHFVKNTRKKTPRERFWSFFCRYSWNYILNGKFNSRWTEPGLFFPELRYFFRLSKRAGEASFLSPPLVVHLWVWLDMHQYPYICLNIFENAWINCSDYAMALNIHDHLTCLTTFWRCYGF